MFTAGPLSINFDRREVRLEQALIKLTPTEYDLLKYMIDHAGKVLTHRMLLAAVWGPAYVDQAQYLRVFIGQLRKKLEPNPARPRFILTDPVSATALLRVLMKTNRASSCRPQAFTFASALLSPSGSLYDLYLVAPITIWFLYTSSRYAGPIHTVSSGR